MKRSTLSLAACVVGGGVLAAAGGAGAQVGSQISEGVHSTGRAGMDTLGQTYNGIGSVASTPFRDFGMVHTKLPPPLDRARMHPYGVRGLTSCEAVLHEVSELDLVLGPDIDTPDIEKHRNMYNNAADLAGSAAVDAMRSAVNHFIPMRDTIRKLTGAEREQNKLEKAILSGKVRRGFLKSYGMQHNCAWPAAPSGFTPAPGGPVWTAMTVQVAPPPAPHDAGGHRRRAAERVAGGRRHPSRRPGLHIRRRSRRDRGDDPGRTDGEGRQRFARASATQLVAGGAGRHRDPGRRMADRADGRLDRCGARRLQPQLSVSPARRPAAGRGSRRGTPRTRRPRSPRESRR